MKFQWIMAIPMAVAAALVACDASEAPPAVNHDYPVTPSLPIAPPNPLRPANTTCLAPERPPSPGAVVLETVFADALTPEQRVKLTDVRQHPADPTRWYVSQQSGQVWTFTDDAPGATLVIDVAEKMRSDHSEAGLVSLALHPDFAENGQFFVLYSANSPPGRNASRIERYTVMPGEIAADPLSAAVILDVPQPAFVHSGNHLVFGPEDGFLYFALGDGGTAAYRPRAQDTGTLYGKILRIDIDTTDDVRDTPYGIPADNPFRDGAAPEVWAHGLRNPWRMAFDTDTGGLYAGDVGHNTWEEINHIEKGANYGWPVMEGPDCFEAETCDHDGMNMPFWHYDHRDGRSVTLAGVYRGTRVPALEGWLLFSDYVFGNLWGIDLTRPDRAAVLLLESSKKLVSFTTTHDGELVAIAYGSTASAGLVRLGPQAPRNDTFPRLLSQTGCVNPAHPTQPAVGVVPYAIRSELWSDGAEKDRFMALPDGTGIEIQPDGDMAFPPGSVLMKHFRFGERFHETRLYVHHKDGWGGYSYRWNDAGTDAELLDVSITETLPSGVRWSYPSRAQCSACHTSAAGYTLGPEVAQLDRAHADMTNQLDALLERGYMAPNVTTETLAPLRATPIPEPFGDGPLADRARSYLHSNCASCHRPGGTTARGDLDLRFGTSFEDTRLCDRVPASGRPWYAPNWREMMLFVPGRPDLSVLHHRMRTTSLFRMPALGSAVHDEAGIALVHDWIAATTECPGEEPAPTD